MSSMERERAVVLRGLHYLGGHPAAPRDVNRVDMFFDETGVSFERAGEHLGTIPWDRVQDLAADAEPTSTRVTVPRVWLFGILAALFRKRERHVLLRLVDDQGAWLFAVEGIRLKDLRSGIAQIRQLYWR